MSRSGAVSARPWWAINAAILLVFLFALSSCIPIPTLPSTPVPSVVPTDVGNIQVTVIGADGKPITDGVVVRVTNSRISDGDDHHEIVVGCQPGQFLAVWAPNYQVGFVACNGSTEYSISLQPLYNDAQPQLNIWDDPNYSWRSAYGDCKTCHDGIRYGAGYSEVLEWTQSGHAKVFTEAFFETVYRGTNIYGESGATTTKVFLNGKLVRKPDLSKGPGFQLDFPGQAGNCAYCHAPSAIMSSQSSVDLTPHLMGGGDSRSEGITCDVCHKVNSVILGNNGYPFPEKPGMLSLQMLRMDGLTTGPFSNILTFDTTFQTHVLGNGRSLCSPIFSSSDFCAACHYGYFENILIYSSYKDWKESPYAANPEDERYRTCQDCHMSHMDEKDKTPYSRRMACSETDEGFQDFSHNLMDFGWDETLQRNIPRMIRGAAELDANFLYEPEKNNSVRARVFVENAKAGHKFPTDSPLRHLILVVEAKDQFNNPLIQVDGDQIPNWGGVNNSYMEGFGIKGYAGLPGKIFANLLVESDINLSPTTAYWNETKPAFVNNKDDLTSDNRLPPQGMDHDRDVSDYFFSVPSDGQVHFKISLIYRFGFYDLMQQKRWPELGERQDIPVVVIECSGNVNNAKNIDCEQIDPPLK